MPRGVDKYFYIYMEMRHLGETSAICEVKPRGVMWFLGTTSSKSVDSGTCAKKKI